MPTKHSKNNSSRGFFTSHERSVADHGTVTQRLGRDSQLPFGYCCLSLHPAEDAVVSPSGHIYSREAILEYILQKTRELKAAAQEYEEFQSKQAAGDRAKAEKEAEAELVRFAETAEGVAAVTKRKLEVDEATALAEAAHVERRRRLIDDTDAATRRENLKQVSPWIPMFTPEAEVTVKAPPKRPGSPMTGRPLRAKDLVPVDLEREKKSSSSSSSGGGDADGPVRFICPVSRKTITQQKVVLIKPSRQMMLESVYQDLARPTMTCPVTGTPFAAEDVVELAQAASGFAASGAVETSKYRPAL